VSPTRINAVVPNLANGYYHWTVTGPGGTGFSLMFFRVY
jgi:hypothetical protein